jgi:zinc-ribbon domain
MFCPNCGVENRSEQNYCRSCGLKLDTISQLVSEQFPTKEYAALQKRKELFEKLGLFSLSIFGFLGFLFLLVAGYYKIILFGADVVLAAALAAFIGFGLLAVFFFNYPKLFMKFEKINPRLSPTEESAMTGQPNSNLIEDKPFEPVPSVTEDSTELLSVENKTRKFR